MALAAFTYHMIAMLILLHYTFTSRYHVITLLTIRHRHVEQRKACDAAEVGAVPSAAICRELILL